MSTLNSNFEMFSKKSLDEEINDFYRRIKVKAHLETTLILKNKQNKKFFKTPKNKKKAPNKYHHIIKTFKEATKNRIKDELKTIRACKYINLSKKQHKALEELKHKENIIKTNAGKGSAVVILDV